MTERLPSCPSSVEFTPRRAQTPLVSPASFATQLVVHPGNAWQAAVTLPPQKGADAAAWRAFFARLDGMIGTFLMGDPANVRRGTATGGTITGTRGAVTVTATLDGTLLAGDYLSCKDRLYTVKADTAGGTLKIWPPLRDTGGAIETADPVGTWRLATPDEGAYTMTPGGFYQFQFSCIEAL